MSPTTPNLENLKMTNRFAALFADIENRNEGAFVPLVTLCDPTPEKSLEILTDLAAAGADAFVLNLAFSDPCADGPETVEAAKRALAAGSATGRAFELVRAFRAAHPDVPLAMRLFCNTLFACGLKDFFRLAGEAGIDAVVLPDLPHSMQDEEFEWNREARQAQIALVGQSSVATFAETLERAAGKSEGLFLLTAGGPAPSDEAVAAAVDLVKNAGVRALAPAETLEAARDAMEAGAAGVYAEAACAALVRENLANAPALKEALVQFAAAMKAALRKA